MAKPILSKDVMPEFGPSHFSMQIETLGLQVKLPTGAVASMPSWHGFPESLSCTTSANWNKLLFYTYDCSDSIKNS